ncbi:ABC transporter permease [Siccirubricoccus sp. KC 17139]|uniref:ABC transporter permease n=1 Tax=Siccirubricoccus soli TaxID=2899147 RepID=A0ABT1D9Z5_9PROT|nr:ABC transporter permease [Siccirubricoccus soli]MCO6418726.1 ABC transporter permease [Siccirubricoccus soli]MCP2684861.1 ABC transporter permease [Siccirubricoccus soli]
MLDQIEAAAPLYVADAAAPRRREKALADLATGFRRWRLPAALARLDIRNRYRGSVLGPFWLTLSTAVMVVGLGILYSSLFKLPLADYLPFLAVSLIVWNMISQIVADACTSLTSSEGIIRQLALPYSVHILRCVMRNALIAAHSLPLILLVFLACGVLPGWEALLALPGLALVAVNAFAIALFLGMVCARFRDIAPIVGSAMQLAFFLSPVLWKPELLAERQVWLPFNPFYVVMETVRGPLVEGGAAPLIWLSAGLYTLLACVVAFAFFVRFRGRIAFWV